VSSITLLGAIAVVSSLPLLWWAVTGPKTAPGVAHNLKSDVIPADARRLQLDRSVRDRATGPAFDRLVALARRLTPAGHVAQLEHRLLLAGTPTRWPIERVLAAKVAGAAVAAVLTFFWFTASMSGGRLLLTLAATAAGYFLPDLLVHNATTKRRLAIQRALADVLDQLTICVEAGLGLEAALLRAAGSGTGPLHLELARAMQDIRAGMGRRDSLKALSARTQVDDLDRVIQAIVQAEAYGLPVARVLRVQSAEMRTKRRQRAEEAAMKLPVKIIFPVIIFIFPALFVVLLGPAAMRIMDVL
jgi:tight adherence protein C